MVYFQWINLVLEPIIYILKVDVIERGRRIAQDFIEPVETAYFVEVNKLSDSEVGVEGFGSTGTK